MASRPIVSYDDITPPFDASRQKSQPPAKKRKRHHKKAQPTEGRELTHDEMWDDSALIDAWDAAMEEYEAFHGPDKGWQKEPVHKSPLSVQSSLPSSPFFLKKYTSADGITFHPKPLPDQQQLIIETIWILNQSTLTRLSRHMIQVSQQRPKAHRKTALTPLFLMFLGMKRLNERFKLVTGPATGRPSITYVLLFPRASVTNSYSFQDTLAKQDKYRSRSRGN